MNTWFIKRVTLAGVLPFAALAVLGEAAVGEEFPFRTTYENVPGAAQIESGNLAAGIQALEQALGSDESAEEGKLLSTLCAAYILGQNFDKAGEVCDEAVAITGSELAYNNRGVFRVMTGDWQGARSDFERARPEQLERYLEELHHRDVGLVANGNVVLMDDLERRYTPADIGRPPTETLAAVEQLGD